MCSVPIKIYKFTTYSESDLNVCNNNDYSRELSNLLWMFLDKTQSSIINVIQL